MPRIFMTGQQLFALVADEETEIDDVYAQLAEIWVILDLDDQLSLFEDDVPGMRASTL